MMCAVLRLEHGVFQDAAQQQCGYNGVAHLASLKPADKVGLICSSGSLCRAVKLPGQRGATKRYAKYLNMSQSQPPAIRIIFAHFKHNLFAFLDSLATLTIATWGNVYTIALSMQSDYLHYRGRGRSGGRGYLVTDPIFQPRHRHDQLDKNPSALRDPASLPFAFQPSPLSRFLAPVVSV